MRYITQIIFVFYNLIYLLKVTNNSLIYYLWDYIIILFIIFDHILMYYIFEIV